MEKPPYFDYLIVGGGVAGVTAAEAIRAKDHVGSILIISREPHPLYSRVLLPGYVRTKYEREKVYLRTVEQYSEKQIEVLLSDEVVAANFETHEVITASERTISFGKILIASGGIPLKWAVPGADSERVFRLQTIDDANRLRERLPILKKEADEAIPPPNSIVFDEGRGKKPTALVVGGGFITLEFLETAAHYGFEVHLFLKQKQIFGDLLEEQGWQLFLDHFRRNKIIPHPETEVKLIEPVEGGLRVSTNTNERFEGSWLGVGIGIQRNTAPFTGTGLDVKHGIRTNQFLESSLPRVWAAGDVAEFFDVTFDDHRMIGNWTNSFLHGRVAGTNMAAKTPTERMELRTVSSYSITHLGLQITVVGDVDSSRITDSIARSWPEARAYERLFFAGNVLRGAILINKFSDKVIFTSWINEKKDISLIKESLRDPNFNAATQSA